MSKAVVIANLNKLIEGYSYCLDLARQSLATVEQWPDVGTVAPPAPPEPVAPTIDNQARAYGVTVRAAFYNKYRLLEVRHLTADQNRGRQCVFVDVLDKYGQRIVDHTLEAVGYINGQRPRRAKLDKREGEPMGNLPLYFNDTMTVGVEGAAGMSTDYADGLHTRHLDELGPKGEIWNSPGHHSFYLRFEVV